MSLKEKLIAAKNKTVNYLVDHKQEIINTALIGATVGTVITLRAMNERMDTHADAINNNAEGMQLVVDNLIVLEKNEDGSYKADGTIAELREAGIDRNTTV